MIKRNDEGYTQKDDDVGFNDELSLAASMDVVLHNKQQILPNTQRYKTN